MAGNISNWNITSPSIGSWNMGRVPSSNIYVDWTYPNTYPFYPSYWPVSYPRPCPSCGHCPTCGNGRSLPSRDRITLTPGSVQFDITAAPQVPLTQTLTTTSALGGTVSGVAEMARLTNDVKREPGVTEEETVRWYVDQYVQSEAGRAEVARLAAELLTEDLEAEIERLHTEGLLLPMIDPAMMAEALAPVTGAPTDPRRQVGPVLAAAPQAEPKKPPLMLPPTLAKQLARGYVDTARAMAKQIADFTGPPDDFERFPVRDQVAAWYKRDPRMDPLALKEQGLTPVQVRDKVYPLRRILLKMAGTQPEDRVRFARRMKEERARMRTIQTGRTSASR